MRNPDLIAELYYGNIAPFSKTFDRKSEYGKLVGTMSKCEDELSKAVENDDVLKRILEQFMNAQGDIIAKNSEERFCEGFRLGAQMLIDIINQPQTELKDITD